MDMCVLPACMPMHRVRSPYGGQRRSLEPLELEFVMVVSCQEGAGICTWAPGLLQAQQSILRAEPSLPSH